MKITLCCNSGANIHSLRSETFEVEDLGYSPLEWVALSEEEKQEVAEQWANERLEIYFKENE